MSITYETMFESETFSHCDNPFPIQLSLINKQLPNKSKSKSNAFAPLKVFKKQFSHNFPTRSSNSHNDLSYKTLMNTIDVNYNYDTKEETIYYSLSDISDLNLDDDYYDNN